MATTDSSQVISQEEMDTLLEPESKAESNTQKNSCQTLNPYDFAQHAKNTLTDLERIETVNELFMRDIDVKITHLICQKSICEAGKPEIIPYTEYVNALEQPSILNLFKINELSGSIVVNFSTSMMMHLLEALFGGNVQRAPVSNHTFGRIEMHIANMMSSLISGSLTTAWQLIKPLHFEYIKSVTNPKVANIAETNAKVLVQNYMLKIAEAESEFSICIPCKTLEPIREHLSIHHQDNLSPEQKRQWQHSLITNVINSEIECAVTISKMRLTINELLTLKKNDIIPINNPEESYISINNVKLFRGKCGTRNGNRAIIITEALKS